MARSKSPSRRAAAKKASKMRKRRTAAKKAATTRKRRTAAKKASITRKRRAAGKKAAATRKRAIVAGKGPARSAGPRQDIAHLDERIAIARDNLRQLAEQAAAVTGGAIEDALQERIAEQEATLQLLLKQRGGLA
jgi:hypothetical protein